MDLLPPEILHLVCSKLSHKDAANLRLVSTKFAEVAAYYLVSQIRFHTSVESLQRLQKLSRHPVFSQTVKTIVYERSLIADVACVHAYVSHFEDERHHATDRPKPPPANATDREMRLYQRNKAKAEQDIMTKWKNYRQLYDAQQVLLQPEGQLFDVLLGQSMSKFVNISHIEFSPLRRCSHHTSQRFNQEYGVSCVVPMTVDSLYSTLQVKNMIVPDGSISNTLREVELYNLSPSFFSGNIPAERILSTFSHLTKITLLIKIASDDFDEDEDAPEDALHRLLAPGILKNALAGARELVSLDIGLVIPDDCGIKTSDIFVDGVSWPHLRCLALDSVTSTGRQFITMLRRQPALKILNVSCMELDTGTWAETINDMRKDLGLDCFVVEGFLQDHTRLFPMSLINEPIYAYDFEAITLAIAIDTYVSYDGSTEEENPLLDGQLENFADEDYLIECYGEPPSDGSDSIDESWDDPLAEVEPYDDDRSASDMMSIPEEAWAYAEAEAEAAKSSMTDPGDPETDDDYISVD